MSPKEKFWQHIEKRLAQSKFGGGKLPGEWNKNTKDEFLIGLQNKIITVCTEDESLKKNYIRESYKGSLKNFELYITTFDGIFKERKFKNARDYTCNQFALYFDVPTWTEYLTKYKLIDSTIEEVSPGSLVVNEDKSPYRIKQSQWATALKQAHGKILIVEVRVHKNNDKLFQSIQYQIGGEWRTLSKLSLKFEDDYFDGWTKFENYHISQIYKAQKLKLKTNKEKDTSVYDRLGVALFNEFFAEGTEHGQFVRECLTLASFRKIEELHLIFTSPEHDIINIPFELLRENIDEQPISVKYDNCLIARTSNIVTSEKSNLQTVPLIDVLKVLIITSLPHDLPEQQKFIELEKEQELIIKAFGDLPSKQKIYFEFVEVASIQEIERALREGKHNVIHLSGHGWQIKSNDNEKIFVRLEKPDGTSQLISSNELVEVFSKYACIKIVIFNTCQSGKAQHAGLANSLNKSGIPIVIGMRFPFTDRAALSFSKTLYKYLSRGHSLANTITEIRRGIFKDADDETKEHPAEWFTPTVFVNQSTTFLVNPNSSIEKPEYFFRRSQLFIPTGVVGSDLQTVSAKLVAEGFVGRRKELAYLHRNFSTGNVKCFCIHGLGGLGKTSLAVRFIDNFLAKSHQIVELTGVVTEEKILSAVISSAPDENQYRQILSHQHLSNTEKFNLILGSLLSKQETIILLDNFEDNLVLDQEVKYRSQDLDNFVNHICTCIQNSKLAVYLIITCRYKLPNSNINHFDIAALNFVDTYKLINRQDNLIPLPFKERTEIYRIVGGHPRAIELLNGCLNLKNDYKWEQVKEQMTAAANRLSKHDILIELIWNKLTIEEQKVCKVASIFEVETSNEAILAVLETMDSDTLTNALNKLNLLSIVYLNDDKFFLHRLTSNWIKSRADADDVRTWNRAIAIYFEDLFFKYEGEELEFANLARHHALNGEYIDIAVDMTAAYSNYLLLRGEFDTVQQNLELIPEELEEEQKVVIGLLKANLASVRGNAKFLSKYMQEVSELIEKGFGENYLEQFYESMSEIYIFQAQYEKAIPYLEKALAISRTKGNDHVVVNNLLELSSLKARLFQWDEVAKLHAEALEISAKSDLIDLKYQVIAAQGNAKYLKGDYEDAIVLLKESLNFLISTGDVLGIDGILSDIGRIYSNLGKSTEAKHYFEMALEQADRTSSNQVKGYTLFYIAQMLFDENGFEAIQDEILAYYNRAINIAENNGLHKLLYRCYMSLVDYYISIEDSVNISQNINKVLKIQQEFPDIPDRLDVVLTMGEVALFNNQPLKALGFFDKIIEDNIGNASDYRGALISKGEVLMKHLNEPQKSREALQKALSLIHKDSFISQITNYNHVAVILEDAGFREEALIIYHWCSALCETSNNSRHQQEFLARIGDIYKELGQYPKAIENYEAAISTKHQLNLKVNLPILYHNLGEAYFLTGELKDALNNSTKAYLLAKERQLENLDEFVVGVRKISEACPQKLIQQVERDMNCSIESILIE